MWCLDEGCFYFKYDFSDKNSIPSSAMKEKYFSLRTHSNGAVHWGKT